MHRRHEYGSGKKKLTWATHEGLIQQAAEELFLALAQKISVWNWEQGQSQHPEDEGDTLSWQRGWGASVANSGGNPERALRTDIRVLL